MLNSTYKILRYLLGWVNLGLLTILFFLTTLVVLQFWDTTFSLPKILLKRVSNQLIEEGLFLEFKSFRGDFRGNLFFKDLVLRQTNSSNPIVKIEQGHLKINLFKKLLGSWDLQFLKINNLDLSASPIFSPTGISSIWLAKTSILYEFENSQHHRPSIFGQYMGIPFSLNADIHNKHIPEGNDEQLTSLKSIVKRYHRFVEKSLQLKPQLDKFSYQEIFLNFWIEGLPKSDRIKISGLAFCKNINAKSIVTQAEEIALTWEADYLGNGFTETSFLNLNAKGLAHKDYSCDNIKAIFKINSLRANPWFESDNWIQGLQKGDYDWNPLSVSLFYKHSRDLFLIGQTFLDDKYFQIKTSINGDLSGEFYAETTADPKTILANVPIFLQNKKLLKILSEVTYQKSHGVIFEGRLEAGAKLAELNFEVDAGKICFSQWNLDRAKAKGHWNGKSLLLHNIMLEQEGSRVKGNLILDFPSETVEMSLWGDFTKETAPPVMPTWWAGIFRNFTDQQIISGDIKVRFPLRKRNDWFFFGNARAEDFFCRNLKVEKGSLKFWGVPQFTSLFDWKMKKADGRFRGELYMIYNDGNPIPQLMGFTLQSNTEPTTLAKSIHQKVLKVVEKFDFFQNPELLVSGAIASKNTNLSEQSWLKVSADSRGFVKLETYPFDDLKFSAFYQNKILNLLEIESMFCKGSLRGNGKLEFSKEGTKVSTKLDLKDASELALRSFLQYSQPLKESFLDGKVSVRGEFNGSYGNFSSFQGSGTTSFVKKNMGKIPLLGIISEISTIGELKLDRAQSDFVFRGNEIDFNNLEITGPITAVSGSGTYQIEDESLDFLLKVLPLRQIPLLSPISKILEIRLEGSLENPNPSLKNSPVNIF